MKSSLIPLFAFLVFIFTFPSFSFAQRDPTNIQIHRIELKDGSVFIGTILSENDKSIRFETKSDIEVTIKKE